MSDIGLVQEQIRRSQAEQRSKGGVGHIGLLVNSPLSTATTALRHGAVHLFVCLSLRPFFCRQNEYKNAIFSKTRQSRAIVSIDDP